MGVEHSGEAIFGRRLHNAKISNELSTLVSGKVLRRCKQTNAATVAAT